jgi:methylated-DNA-[protein]-cysteine S-methyltransferase
MVQAGYLQVRRSQMTTTSPVQAALPAQGIWTTSYDSPLGPLTLTARQGALVGLSMENQAHRVPPPEEATTDADALAGIVTQLDDYFAGRRTSFDVPLALEGTDFQRRVWSELCAIPYGATITYGELARRVGKPGASRAVGQANGRNPVAIIVPCHRVVAGNGGLGGYGGGLNRKQTLLDLERSNPADLTRPVASPALQP